MVRKSVNTMGGNIVRHTKSYSRNAQPVTIQATGSLLFLDSEWQEHVSQSEPHPETVFWPPLNVSLWK